MTEQDVINDQRAKIAMLDDEILRLQAQVSTLATAVERKEKLIRTVLANYNELQREHNAALDTVSALEAMLEVAQESPL